MKQVVSLPRDVRPVPIEERVVMNPVLDPNNNPTSSDPSEESKGTETTAEPTKPRRPRGFAVVELSREVRWYVRTRPVRRVLRTDAFASLGASNP